MARAVAPGYPHHITQRGNNRGEVFSDREDRKKYLDLLIIFSRQPGTAPRRCCLADE
jgi:putative transposase